MSLIEIPGTDLKAVFFHNVAKLQSKKSTVRFSDDSKHIYDTKNTNPNNDFSIQILKHCQQIKLQSTLKLINSKNSQQEKLTKAFSSFINLSPELLKYDS